MKRLFFGAVVCLSLNAATGLAAEAPRVTHADTARKIPYPNQLKAILAEPGETPSTTAVIETTLPAGTLGAPPHVHAHEDEYFYVLEGSVQFLDRERTLTATKGSLAVLPRGQLHGFWNESDEPARLLLIVSPGGFAGFFDEVAGEIRNANTDSPEVVAKLISEAAAKRGVQIFPEKLPAAAKRLQHRAEPSGAPQGHEDAADHSHD